MTKLKSIDIKEIAASNYSMVSGQMMEKVCLEAWNRLNLRAITNRVVDAIYWDLDGKFPENKQ